MVTLNGPATAHARPSDQDMTEAIPAAYQLVAENVRAARAGQSAAWQLGVETFTQGQRLWWDQWHRIAEVSLAFADPITARQIDQRFELAERQAAEHQDAMRTEIDQAITRLREAQREWSQAQAKAVREAMAEQRDERVSLDKGVQKLTVRLDQLAKVQAQQLETIQAALAEQEQRLRDRLGDRIRSAVGSIEVPKPNELAELRDGVAALSEAVAAIRQDLASLGRERREEPVEKKPTPSPARPPSGNGGAKAEASGKQ